MTRHGLDIQLQIYGRTWNTSEEDTFPVSLDGWRDAARARLADGPWGYLENGAGREETMAANRRSFEKWAIRPRVCRNVDDRNLTISLLGREVPAPFVLAPIGVQSIVHADGEKASAQAAAAVGIPFVVSTVSSIDLETVADSMGDSLRWFQLYPGKDKDVVSSFIGRAERAGYGALVVTVDTTMLGWRETDLKNAYLPFLHGEGLANFLTDPVFRARLPKSPEEDPVAAIRKFLDVYVNPGFTWDDLADIRRQTRLPLLVKGITHSADAAEALAVGADGIIVSNHGGRQVDGAVSALDALVEIRASVGQEAVVLMDSGIRSAADGMKAIALGADAILVGRPYAYALATGGQAGVERWIAQFLAEWDLEMALSGCRTVSEIDRSMVTPIG